MTLTKFNDEMVMRFIRAYKDTACLWDTKHPNYKDRSLRSAMYQYLVQVMNIPGFTVKDVKNKIKNIRSTYCQELKKMQQHKLLGLEPYMPTNVWFAEFHEFMSSNIMQRDTHSNHMMNYPVGECVLTENLDNLNMSCVVSSVTSINGGVTEFNSDISQTTDSMMDNYSAMTNGMPASVEVMLNRLEKLSQSLVRQQKQHKDDEFDSFGKSVAQQLRRLPLVSAMKLKIKIQTLLSEERISCLGEKGKKKREKTGDDIIVMEEEEESKEKTEKVTETIEIIMDDEEEEEENQEKSKNLVEIIIEDEIENKQTTEKVVQNSEVAMDEKEERPSSRASELSLHVSCSSSDDEESETEY